MQFSETALSPRERLGRIKTRMREVAESELATYALYQHISCRSSHHATPALARLSQTAQIEDMDHYWLMQSGIRRLGGVEPIPDDTLAGLLEDSDLRRTALREILRLLRDAEARLVHGYQEICALAMEFDYQIFDLAFRNMQENALHQASLESILRGGQIPAEPQRPPNR